VVGGPNTGEEAEEGEDMEDEGGEE